MHEHLNTPTLATPLKNICFVLAGRRVSGREMTVVVLGVERGGTSMAAGIVRALGVNMGKRAGLNHEDPLFLVSEEDKLKRRIKTRDREEDVWGFKVPKASLQLDFYEKNLRNPHYVVVYRNSLAIVDSWVQRGAGNAIDVLDRISTYHDAILGMLRKTRNPVLLLNYERAVQDEESKSAAVSEIASFLDVSLDPDLIARAVGMMTGDGRGYVNLPEHFFQVTPSDTNDECPELAIVETTPENRQADGWVVHDKVPPQIIYAPEDGGNLPKAFWLEVDLAPDAELDLASDPMRFYFDFTGDFFPGHCARPKLKIGLNRYYIETSGLARRLAFGPLSLPSRFSLTARFYAASADGPDVLEPAPERNGAATLAPSQGFARKILRKVFRHGA